MDFETLNQLLDECDDCKAFDTKEGCNKTCPLFHTRQGFLNAMVEKMEDWPMNIAQAVPRL